MRAATVSTPGFFGPAPVVRMEQTRDSQRSPVARQIADSDGLAEEARLQHSFLNAVEGPV